MDSKIYFWGGVSLANEELATKATASNLSIPLGPAVVKNVFICLVISWSLLMPCVSPNPGVSITVIVWSTLKPS